MTTIFNFFKDLRNDFNVFLHQNIERQDRRQKVESFAYKLIGLWNLSAGVGSAIKCVVLIPSSLVWAGMHGALSLICLTFAHDILLIVKNRNDREPIKSKNLDAILQDRLRDVLYNGTLKSKILNPSVPKEYEGTYIASNLYKLGHTIARHTMS